MVDIIMWILTAELRRQVEHSGAKAVFTVPVCVDKCKEADIKVRTTQGTLHLIHF